MCAGRKTARAFDHQAVKSEDELDALYFSKCTIKPVKLLLRVGGHCDGEGLIIAARRWSDARGGLVIVRAKLDSASIHIVKKAGAFFSNDLDREEAWKV